MITQEQADYIWKVFITRSHCLMIMQPHEMEPFNKGCDHIETRFKEALNECVNMSLKEESEPRLLQDLRLMVKDLKKLRSDFDNFTAGIYKC